MGRGKWFTSHKETTFAHFPALREAAHGSCHIRQQNSHIFLPCVKWHTWITSHKATKFAHFSALWDVAHGSRLIWQPNSRTFRQATLSKEGCVCIHISKYVYMGWLRLVGSLKLQVSLAGYSRFYRTLLQKRLIISRRILIVATPYPWHESSIYAHIYIDDSCHGYGVATISILLKIIGLFCKRAL